MKKKRTRWLYFEYGIDILKVMLWLLVSQMLLRPVNISSGVFCKFLDKFIIYYLKIFFIIRMFKQIFYISQKLKDCMNIFLKIWIVDKKTKCFGIYYSNWRSKDIFNKDKKINYRWNNFCDCLKYFTILLFYYFNNNYYVFIEFFYYFTILLF